MSQPLLQQFISPDNAYRGKPFWSWNGELDKEELIRQIHVFKEMGFGGFFMHSRTGLITEYLGKEWFELIEACALEAQKLGMEAWLYDEDRWPSGTAGGLVTEDPQYRMNYVTLEISTAAQVEWAEDIVAIFTACVNDTAYTDCNEVARGEQPQLEDGYSWLVFRRIEMNKSSFYNGFTYLDTMNPEATARYLELTHEKYKAACGDLLGNAITGIFTDEPHRGSLMDPFGASVPNPRWTVPWTGKLLEEFHKAFGYELRPLLPEVFLRPEGKRISQVKWHFVELLQRLFLNGFAKPMLEWCRENNLRLTGHILHEDSLSAQVAMSGAMMRYYEHMDDPGVDVLTEGNDNYWVVKQLSSVARQTGKKWLMSELYGCTGWQMNFASHKAVGDWQALFGINFRCHHLSWYTMEGESKRDFPGSISYQSAWWREYEHVETYFSRLNVLLTHGTPVCGLLVVHPVESVWCQVYPGWSTGLNASDPDIVQIETHFRNTFHWLASARIDFDYGDEDIIGRLGSIEQSKDGPLLRVGEMVYRAVAVSGMATIRSTTLALLEQFAAAGGKVIFAGEAPQYVDALPSARAGELAAAAAAVPLEQAALVAACSPYSLQVQVVRKSTGEQLEDIYAQVREEGDERWVVLLNVNRTTAFEDAEVHLQGYNVQEWDCQSGERSIPVHASADGRIVIQASFPAGGERVYRIEAEPAASVPEQLPSQSIAEQSSLGTIEGPFAYTLSEPNVCVLDRASYSLDGGEWSEPGEILKIDRQLRSRLGLAYRGGEMIQPWFARKYHPASQQSLGQLRLRFAFSAEVLPEAPVELVLERPERWSITLNGQPLTVPEHEETWVDHSFKRVPIPGGMLREGANAIELAGDFHAGVDLEAIYLLGAFGVRLEETDCHLVALPSTLEVGSVTSQGLPFYSGTITYHLAPEAIQAAIGGAGAQADSLVLKLASCDGACMRVSSKAGGSKLLAWHPYEAELPAWQDGVELDIILTRRNTFGPLHLLPAISMAYGPDHYITEGIHFSEACVLLPAGLTSAPELLGSTNGSSDRRSSGSANVS